MRLVVTAEERLQRTPDGAVWSTGAFANGFWRRYLAVFDEVSVAARIATVPTVAAGMARVDGDGVSVCCLPHYHGPAQFLRRRTAIRRTLRARVSPADAVLVRAPSAIGTVLCSVLADRGQRYGVEVVGDPLDVFAPGAVTHPLRPLFRRWFVAQLRRQCRRAIGAAYVTEGSLQARYPTGPAAFSTSYSSIELDTGAFAARPRTGDPRWADGSPDTQVIVTVGSLEQLYKGTDTLLGAVALLIRADRPVRLVVVGDGRYRPMLESLAERLGVAEAVEFTGSLPPGAPVRRRLDEADLFALPSRAEGLPKAVIEAMARGLPCVASTVGGNPELLAAADLVPPGDPRALADLLSDVLSDRARLAAMSARNLARARDFSIDLLRPRRESFYLALRDAVARGASSPS
ncbi:MAG: phosphatidyl-myo-inositol dimannoside synthase [Micromonosporaceae bacterium]|nr:phosphatidyl-myo-inositol dimannoside synthase [Micromonosporaceae bacterium]